MSLLILYNGEMNKKLCKHLIVSFSYSPYGCIEAVVEIGRPTMLLCAGLSELQTDCCPREGFWIS